ncbi:phosphatase PAP2 family protein [Maribacter sp.]|nr:phosphatase PAP2 family protein [Maribacter sp.]
MWETLIQYDKELFLMLNNMGTSTWDAFWMFLTHKLSSIPLYALLLFLSFKKFGLRATLLLLIAVALMITATNGLADFFKYGVQRLRPCFDPDLSDAFRLVKSHCGGKYGYFSAHAANTSAVAMFFLMLLKSKFRFIGIFLMAWAFLVAYSRIYIGVHFPLDVLSGIGIGLIFGWIFAKLYIFALFRFPK